MPKVKVPSSVLNSLETVRSSGLVNMADLRGIKELVPTEVGEWLDKNRSLYMEGFFYGFEAEEDN